MKDLNSAVKRTIISTLVQRKKYSISENHYIFSSPRGGSTWLMEMIQTITNEPVIWEPLFLGIEDNPFKKLNFGWRQHIPENVAWREAKTLFDELFTGKILTEKILNHSSFSQIVISKSLLFKICRGSALLPWLTNNYSFSFKPIYLIRHPFAVASSQLRHGAWDYPFSEYTIPDTPFNDGYIQHESFLRKIKTREEALVAEWCLTNLIPLKHPDNNIKWLTINYEEFVLNPEKTVNRILQSWGLEYDLSTINFNKDSATTKKDSPDLTIERLSNWKNHLNDKQIESMGNVLNYFNVKCYSESNPFPEKIFNYGSQHES